MKKANKKALYESIMKNVSKVVKKQLNESNDPEYVDEVSATLYSTLEENLDEEDFETVRGYLMEIVETLKNMVEPMVDKLSNEDRFDAEIAEWDKAIYNLRDIFG